MRDQGPTPTGLSQTPSAASRSTGRTMALLDRMRGRPCGCRLAGRRVIQPGRAAPSGAVSGRCSAPCLKPAIDERNGSQRLLCSAPPPLLRLAPAGSGWLRLASPLRDSVVPPPYQNETCVELHRYCAAVPRCSTLSQAAAER